jgi:hypothetical protein
MFYGNGSEPIVISHNDDIVSPQNELEIALSARLAADHDLHIK